MSPAGSDWRICLTFSVTSLIVEDGRLPEEDDPKLAGVDLTGFSDNYWIGLSLLHTLFARDGEDIILELPISFPRAAMGGKIEVPTLGGRAKVTIPAGIQSGQVLRLRGKGLKSLHRSGTGDQLIRVTIHTPNKVSDRGKKLLTELDDLPESVVPPPRRPDH